MHEIVLSKEATKALQKVTPEMQGRIVGALEKLKGNPLAGKRLKGQLEGLFSLRIGDMRAIYEVDAKQSNLPPI